VLVPEQSHILKILIAAYKIETFPLYL